jgi:hypothetical protein
MKILMKEIAMGICKGFGTSYQYFYLFKIIRPIVINSATPIVTGKLDPKHLQILFELSTINNVYRDYFKASN